MNRYSASWLLAAMFALAVAAIGCGPKPDQGSAVPPVDEHAGPGYDESDMEKMKVELAKLSPEDAASAEKQHFCPVSDEMLGTMGAPKKVDVMGQQVWICCDGCRDKLLKSPDQYLAKLKKE